MENKMNIIHEDVRSDLIEHGEAKKKEKRDREPMDDFANIVVADDEWRRTKNLDSNNDCLETVIYGENYEERFRPCDINVADGTLYPGRPQEGLETPETDVVSKSIGQDA